MVTVRGRHHRTGLPLVLGYLLTTLIVLPFMPAKTDANRKSWWTAVIAAGPGWVVLGALKQLGGAFLAFCALGAVGASAALEPIAPYVAAVRPNLVSGPDSGASDLSATHTCTVCDVDYELPDVVDCAYHGGAVCSLCCTLETGCEQVCQRADTESVLLSITARPSA